MRTTISAAVVAAVSAVAVLAPATAALAKAETLKDAKGDVYKVTYNGETENFVKSKKKFNVDVKKTVVTHSKKRVQAKVWYVDLAKDGFPIILNQLRVKTDAGREFQLYGNAVKMGKEPWQSGAYLYEVTDSAPQRAFTPRGFVSETCDQETVKFAIDWKKNTITMSAPRGCFGDPTWVKGHGDAVAGDDMAEGVAWYDNPHNKGHDLEKGWTGKLKKG